MADLKQDEADLDQQVQDTTPPPGEEIVVEDLDSDLPEAQKEIDEDNLDLQIDNLSSTIEAQREVAFNPQLAPELQGMALSLPDIMSTHSKKLGLTEKQFARAAANQGLDLGVIVSELGMQGLPRDEVYKKLESGGAVVFKPEQERREGIKKIRQKRLIEHRGQQINQIGQQRIRDYEKELDYSVEDLREAYQSETVDFKKIRDPSKRQLEVAKIVYDMGSQAGLSDDQMAAILVNGIAESRLDPYAKNKRDGEDSHGIWQFNRSGSGEGSQFTVEQLQDPRFQMSKVIDAVQNRDNLKGFRDTNADANELIKQFMVEFERPGDQSDKKIKERQAYFGQANRLLQQAKKAPKASSGIIEKDRAQRQEILDRLRGKDKKKGAFVLKTDGESIDGDVRNEIAQPGSQADERYQAEVNDLLMPENSTDPERAQFMQQLIAQYSGGMGESVRETFADSAFMSMYHKALEYDRDLAAKKLGQTRAEFNSRMQKEGSREALISAEIETRNRRHMALYVTTRKIGVPGFVSYEFMDPENKMGEDRVTDDDSYLSRLGHYASRNRAELVGLDGKGVPVYRAQGHVDSLTDKLDLHLSVTSGALERLINGPEGESIIKTLQEGSIEGVKKSQNFTKTLLSTDAARESGWYALPLGATGFLIDVLAPDPTFGFAKAAQSTRKGLKVIRPFINKRYVPATLNSMRTAATDMVEAQTLILRASEKFAADDIEGGNKLLEQAKTAVATAEEAERKVRKELPYVMRQVDRTDAEIAQEIARDVPLLTGRGSKELDEVLAFDDFGLRRDYVHPSVERVTARGASESQIVAYPEFFDVSRKIGRLQDLAGKVKNKDTSGAFVPEVQAKVMDGLIGKVKNQLTSRGFSRVKGADQTAEVTKAVDELMEFMQGSYATKLLAESPTAFEAQLLKYINVLPTKESKTGRTVMEDIFVDVGKAHKAAKKIAAKSVTKEAATDFRQELVDVTRSLAGIAESRGAAHAFTRSALAQQEKVTVDPVISAVMNRYDEIGTGKISGSALTFRNELELAFPAMRGDAAMHIARNLDDRLKAIHRQTGETVSSIYETREFKDIIPNLRRKMGGDEYAASRGFVDDPGAVSAPSTVEAVTKAIDDSPQFTKLDNGEELLTTQGIRDFTRNISDRLDREDLTDFTAALAVKTTKELKAFAKSRGMKGYAKLRKSDLIEAITKNEKKKTFLPDEYLRRNPEIAAQHETAKKKVVDAQKDFEKAIDELDALEAANSPTVRDMLNQPSAAIEAALKGSPDAEVITIADVQIRAFKRDLAEGRVRMMSDIRDQRVAELENLRRVAEGKADETLSLAEELDFIPGLIVKVEGGTLKVSTIGLPEELQKKGLATTLYKLALGRAKKDSLGFTSDVNPSPEAQRIYEKLIDDGLPLKKVVSRQISPEHEAARRLAESFVDELKRIDEINPVVDELFTAPYYGIGDGGTPRLFFQWQNLADLIEYFSREGTDPNPLAYDRLMDIRSRLDELDASTDFLSALGSKPFESVRYIAEAGDLARLSDDVLQVKKVKAAGDGLKSAPKSTPKAPTPKVGDPDYIEDTQKVIRSMEESASIDDFITEIAKVSRKELSSEQMGIVTKWLASKGVEVSFKGSKFVGKGSAGKGKMPGLPKETGVSPSKPLPPRTDAEALEAVDKAEDMFAKALIAYAKGRPAPTPEMTSGLERIKARLMNTFSSAKSAASDGAKFTPSSEIEEVFDGLLFGAQPLRSGTPNIIKALKRTLLDDLPNKVGDEFLLRLAQESDRLGHPISVAELKKLVLEASEKLAKNPDADVTIDLPGPVSLGGLMSLTPKSSYSISDFALGASKYAARKEMFDNPATRKIALENEVQAIKELKPTDMIDQYVANSKIVGRSVKAMYIGGDALFDMRDLPPTVRQAIMAGTRAVQQTVGDTVTLISEGGGSLVRYMTGDPTVKFKYGRNVLSAGHDKMGSSVDSLNKYFAHLADPNDGSKSREAFGTLKDRFMRPIGSKLGQNPADVEKIVDAFRTVVFQPGGSTLLKDIFTAAKVGPKTLIEPKHLKMLESIFHITDNSQRKGIDAAKLSSAAQFESLYRDLNKLYPVTKWSADVEPVANRVTVLLAGHGEAQRARMMWADIGLAVDAKSANNFKRWIMGEALDSPEDLQKVREIFQVNGYNPSFLDAANLEGLDFYVPEQARKKLSMALEMASDPTLKGMSQDMLDQIASGLREAESTQAMMAAWTARYIKTRMVRGHYLLKGRYFWMNTMDHFNQMSQIVGFRPAFISTIRVLPQTWINNPAGQAAIFAAQKAGNKQAGEAMRMSLQTAGDKGADWAATLTRASKWRGDVNSVLEARKGFLVVDGIPHAYADLRRIGVEEGMSASFDTAELGTKIRNVGETFLEDVKKRQGKLNIPGAPSLREWVKVAEDMAEGWSERERYGAMLTLVEMGVEPRKAARLVIDGLYDYAGSMSKADRHFLVNIFLPFWAFQKNANRQLVDVIFSPRGAYRLGVLRRGYTQGSELWSELLYEDIVDPLGINTKYMSQEEREIYDNMMVALSKEFDNMPLSRLPPALRRQLRMALTKMNTMREGGNEYKINEYGLQLRDRYAEQFGDFFVDRAVDKPSRTSMPLYDAKRDAVLVPNVMDARNKIYNDLFEYYNPGRTFTSFVLPEQSYKAAANHVALVTYAMVAGLNELRNVGPAWFSDADNGEDLFSMKFPWLEIIQPERALMAADMATAFDLNKEAVPYRVAPLIAKQLDQMGIEILPIEESEDPLDKIVTYSEAMEKYRSGESKILPDDPFLRGATLEPTKRYYVSGGLASMIMKNSILDELNNVLKKWEKTPFEKRAGMRGDLQRLARSWGIVDIREVNPEKTARGEAYEAPKESGADSYLDVATERNLRYIDIEEDYPEVDKYAGEESTEVSMTPEQLAADKKELDAFLKREKEGHERYMRETKYADEMNRRKSKYKQ